MAANWPEIVKTRNKLKAVLLERIETPTALYLTVRRLLPHLPACAAWKLSRRYDHARRTLTREEFDDQERTRLYCQQLENCHNNQQFYDYFG